MAKIIVSQLVKTSLGIIAEDSNGKKIDAKSLLQAGEMELGGHEYKINIIKSSNFGVSSAFNTASNNKSISIGKKPLRKDFIKNIKTSTVSKTSSNKFKSGLAKYNLVLIHRKKNAKGVIKDYKYDLVENATGNELSVNRADIEAFFSNPNWDGSDKSKKLLSGKDALVSGLTQQYYAKDNTWHLRVGKSIPFVVDEDIDTTMDSYVMTDVWARTILTSNGKHKLDKYGYTLMNERTNESDYYTRDQLFSIFEIKNSSMSSRYDVSRLKNAVLQYYKSQSGAESWRVRPNESKVNWHIDESINTNTKDRYVCLKAYRVKVPSKNGTEQNQYVEFELAKLEDGELKDNTETFIVTGLDLISLVEIPNTVEYPFYDSSRIDNLKIKNKKGSSKYEREAEIEVYKPGKLPSSCVSKIEPVIIDLDYNVWSKSHTEHANKIEKFIKAKEDKAINKVITWEEVLSQPLSDSDMSIVNVTFEDFWNNRFNCSCRLATLSLTNEDDSVFYDITPLETEQKIPNTFVVKESRNSGSLRSVSVLKFLLDGEEPQDISDALGHHWVRFLSCICRALNRKLVMVVGVLDNKRYAISCVDEDIQKKVLSGSEVYYLPLSWNEEVNVTVKAENQNDAEQLALSKLNFMNNLPKERKVITESIKLDEEVANDIRSSQKSTIRPDDIDMSIEDDSIGEVDFTRNEHSEVTYIMPDIKNENIYLVTATLEIMGYMAVKATSEEKAFTDELKKILDGKTPFAGKGQLLPYSATIVSCVLLSGKEPGVYDRDWFIDALPEYLDINADKTVQQELTVLSEETNTDWLVMRLDNDNDSVYLINLEMSPEKYPVVCNIVDDKIQSLIPDGIDVIFAVVKEDIVNTVQNDMNIDTVENICNILGFTDNLEKSDSSDDDWDSIGSEEEAISELPKYMNNDNSADKTESIDEELVDIAEDPNEITYIGDLPMFEVDLSGIDEFKLPLDMNKKIQFNNQVGFVDDLLEKLAMGYMKVVDNNSNFTIPLNIIGHSEYGNKLKELFRKDRLRTKYNQAMKYQSFSFISNAFGCELIYKGDEQDEEDDFELSYKLSPNKFEGLLTFNHFSKLDSDITKKILYVDAIVSNLFTPDYVDKEIMELDKFYAEKAEEDNIKYLKEYWELVRPDEEFDPELAKKLMAEKDRRKVLKDKSEKSDEKAQNNIINENDTLTRTVGNVQFKLRDGDEKIPGTRPKLIVRDLFDNYLTDGGYEEVCKLFKIDYSRIVKLANAGQNDLLSKILYPYEVSCSSLGMNICENLTIRKAIVSIIFSCVGVGTIDLSFNTDKANILTRNEVVNLISEFVDKVYDVLMNFDNYTEEFELDEEGKYVVPQITKNMFLKSKASFEINKNANIVPVNSQVDVLNTMSVEAYSNFVLKNTLLKDYNGLVLRTENWKRKDVLTLLEKKEAIEAELNSLYNFVQNENGFDIISNVVLASKDDVSINAKFITKVTSKPAKLKCSIEIDDMRWLTSVEKFIGSWVEYDVAVGGVLLKVIGREKDEETLSLDWDSIDDEQILEQSESIDSKSVEPTILLDQSGSMGGLRIDNSEELSFDFNSNSIEEEDTEDIDLDGLFDSLDSIDVQSSENSSTNDFDLDEYFDSSDEVVLNNSSLGENIGDDTETGLEDLEDLEQSSVTVDLEMFKYIFDELLKVIDSEYESNSFDVVNDKIAFKDSKIYTNTKDSVKRIKELLVNINPVKIGSGYLRLIESLEKKSLYDCILEQVKVIATLAKYRNGLGNDFVNTNFKEDLFINAIASPDILTKSLSDTGIEANNFKFLQGVKHI